MKTVPVVVKTAFDFNGQHVTSGQTIEMPVVDALVHHRHHVRVVKRQRPGAATDASVAPVLETPEHPAAKRKRGKRPQAEPFSETAPVAPAKPVVPEPIVAPSADAPHFDAPTFDIPRTDESF